MMQRIVVLNPKGGSGKTTLATNLASYYAAGGFRTTLMDYDSQGSSSFWAGRRGPERAPIQVITAYKIASGVTRNWALRVPPGTERLIVDTPAAADFNVFRQTLQEASAILIPVLPSEIDIHAVSRCIAELLVALKINRQERRIAVVANRVRRNTLIYQKLQCFLKSLDIPFVATLRDTQNYIRLAENGLGIFEMPANLVRDDLASWQPLLEWVEQCRLRTAAAPAAVMPVPLSERIAL